MNKGLLLAMTGFAGLCSSSIISPACRAQQPDNFRLDNPNLFRSDSPLSNFNSSNQLLGLTWSEPVAATSVTSPAGKSSRSLTERLTDSLSKFDYASGEVGFLYGRSAGKYGGELKRGYIMGEAGNEKTQIFVGASYEDSSFHFPRGH